MLAVVAVDLIWPAAVIPSWLTVKRVDTDCKVVPELSTSGVLKKIEVGVAAPLPLPDWIVRFPPVISAAAPPASEPLSRPEKPGEVLALLISDPMTTIEVLPETPVCSVVTFAISSVKDRRPPPKFHV
jgi:hypothetical protein